MILLIKPIGFVASLSSGRFGVVSPILFEGLKVTKDG